MVRGRGARRQLDLFSANRPCPSEPCPALPPSQCPAPWARLWGQPAHHACLTPIQMSGHPKAWFYIMSYIMVLIFKSNANFV